MQSYHQGCESGQSGYWRSAQARQHHLQFELTFPLINQPLQLHHITATNLALELLLL